MRTTIIAAALVAALAGLVLTSGCRAVPLREQPANRVITESSKIGPDGATSADANIMMGIGKLSVRSSDTTALVDTYFRYAPVSWKPRVSYTNDHGVGLLKIAQDKLKVEPMTAVTSEWDLAFSKTVPLNLTLEMGVGESDVDLSGLKLLSLNVVSGVGSSKITLPSEPTSDLVASVSAGVGEVTIQVPKGVGVRVTGDRGGIGDLTAVGFTRSGDALVNDAYAGSGPKIELHVVRGIGAVRIEQVD
jgi:hypothetical protein